MECKFRCTFVQVLLLCLSATSALPPELVQTEPSGTVCLGDRVVLTCMSSTGVLVWAVGDTTLGTFIQSNNPSVGATLDPMGLNVSAVLTDVDRNTNPWTFTSTLTFSSMVNDLVIFCGGLSERTNTTLMPMSLDMVEALIRGELTAASVTVTVLPMNTECVGMYVVMATPVNGGGTVTTESTTSPVQVVDLNFCESNYDFTVVVRYRSGGKGPSTTVTNVQGDPTSLNSVTEVIMSPTDGLQWRAPAILPPNCIIGYGISWNGGALAVDGDNVLSVTNSTLRAAGFPICDRSNVIVTPIFTMFGALESKAEQSSTPILLSPLNISPPQNLMGSFVSLSDEVGWIVASWTPLAPEIFGNVPDYTCTSDISGSRRPCDSNGSHSFTFPYSTSLTGRSIDFTVAADFRACHVESSISVTIDDPSAQSLGYVGAIAISVIIPSLLTFILGLVMGIAVMFRCSRRKLKPHNDVIKQADPGPVYDEVSPKTEKFEMGENMAYGPTAVDR